MEDQNMPMEGEEEKKEEMPAEGGDMPAEGGEEGGDSEAA